MNRFDQNQLLTEILADGELSKLRRASLENGLAMLRSRRRARTLRACALLILSLALLAGVFLHRPGTAGSGQAALATPRADAREAGTIKIINDEELLALFPGRSVALVGKPGEQQLVFLDRPVARQSRQ